MGVGIGKLELIDARGSVVVSTCICKLGITAVRLIKEVLTASDGQMVS